MDAVIQFLQSLGNHLKGTAFVVGYKILDILQIKCLWAVSADYVCHVKEQSALGFVLEACFATKAVFLGNAGN